MSGKRQRNRNYRSAALSSQLGEKLRKEFEGRERDLDKQFAQREAEVTRLEESIGKRREAIDQQLTSRLAAEREKLRAGEAANPAPSSATASKALPKSLPCSGRRWNRKNAPNRIWARREKQLERAVA